MIDIAILIPSLTDRAWYFANLIQAFAHQVARLPAEDQKRICVFSELDSGEARLGTKRNILMQKAIEVGARYIAFFDDDDLPGPNYIKIYLAAVKAGVDVAELRGQIYFGGRPGKPFLHSLKYTSWYEDKFFYYRCPNHLNLVKLDLVKHIPYKEIDFGEDGQWSYQVRDEGVLKTEHHSKEVIYHYFTGDKAAAAAAYAAHFKKIMA